jgi:thiol:disulfide interchange protein DsbC
VVVKRIIALVLVGVWLAVLGSASAQEQRASEVAERVWALPEEELIIYSPEEPRYGVTVFTDVNCPFCREMHRLMEDFLMWDIAIRYAAFPTIGNARAQMDAVWCSPDRKEAISRAKSGETVEAAPCDNPVERHLALAMALRFIGTPAIVTPKGKVLYGRIAAPELAELLEEEAGR